MAQKRVFIGIDPGVSGAYAIIDEDFKILSLENFTNFKKFWNDLGEYGPFANIERFIVLEDVRIWPGASSQSSTTFMKQVGGLEAIIEVHGVKYEKRLPEKWQKEIGGFPVKPITKGLEKKEADRIKREHKNNIKAHSIKIANAFFGTELSKKEDGKADALNMARLGFKIIRGS